MFNAFIPADRLCSQCRLTLPVAGGQYKKSESGRTQRWMCAGCWSRYTQAVRKRNATVPAYSGAVPQSPLTEEQIREAYLSCGPSDTLWIDFARAIEHAHNIR